LGWAGGPLSSAAQEEDQATTSIERIDPMDDAIAGRRRVYRHTTYRQHRRYRPVHSHSRVVVVSSHRHHVAQPQVSRPHRNADISVGLRFTALSLGNTDLRYETFEGASMGGVGGYLRGKIDSNWGIEISADAMGNASDEYDQVTVPVMGALMGHLFPGSPVDVYGLAGGGVLFTSIDYQPMALGGRRRIYSESYMQAAGQFGGGVELNLGALELTTDIRYLLLQARPDRDDAIRAVVPLSETTSSADSDSVAHALQFLLGIGGNF